MSETSTQSESHIDTIVRQEEEALQRRSGSERFADGVGGFAGSLTFVVLHIVLLIVWLLVNSGKISTIRTFDPKCPPCTIQSNLLLLFLLLLLD
jgi:uncharacterized membrane protein